MVSGRYLFVCNVCIRAKLTNNGLDGMLNRLASNIPGKASRADES